MDNAAENGVVEEKKSPVKPQRKRRGYKTCLECYQRKDEPFLYCSDCDRSYHPSCVKGYSLNSKENQKSSDWKCKDCSTNTWTCIVCGERGPVESLEKLQGLVHAARDINDTKPCDSGKIWRVELKPQELDTCGICKGETPSKPVFRCKMKHCITHYHFDCIPKDCMTKSGEFKCPAHECHECKESNRSRKLLRCIDCTKAYHRNCSLGCLQLADSPFFMVCSEHKDSYDTVADDIEEDNDISGPIFDIPVWASEGTAEEQENGRAREVQKVDKYLDLNTPVKPGFWRHHKIIKEFKIPRSILQDVERSKTIAAMRPPKFKKVRVNQYPKSMTPFTYKKGELPTCLCKKDGNTWCGKSCHNRVSNIECLRCGDGCQNQRLLKRQWVEHQIKYTEGRGFGFFSKQDIKEDDLIIEYVGEIIDEVECTKRMQKMQAEGAQNFYFLQVRAGMVVDATHIACNARFMNHSCDPNCYAQRWIVNNGERVGKRAPSFLYTSWNYNFSTVGQKSQKCLCGAANCSGTFGVKPLKNETDVDSKKNKRKKYDVGASIEYDSWKEVDQTFRRNVKKRKLHIPKNKREEIRSSGLFLLRNFLRVRESMLGIREDIENDYLLPVTENDIS